jgi:serralysin
MKRLLSLSLLTFVVSGCAPESSTPPTWEEFQASATVEPETGFYIVNGDELVETPQELALFYQKMVANWDTGATVGESSQELIVNRVGGKDDKWSTTTAANLTYCVSKSGFGSRYTAVVNAMASATATWQATANVKFVHNAAQDTNCTASNTSVLFDVRQTSTQSYLARSFFPSTGRSARNVLISTSSFSNISPYTLTGVLRHELGHVIGFRHEHTRPDSGTCFEDNNWRALTTYDAASVMMYPQCNGTNQGDLVLTARDKSGARSLYP